MAHKCCGFIQYALYFGFEDEIRTCSNASHVGGGKIILAENISKNGIDIEKINEKRKVLYNSFLKDEIYPNCTGCVDLNDWELAPELPKIKILFLQHWTKCNSSCIYCYTHENKKFYNSRKTYKAYNILKNMIRNDYLDKNGIVNFSGGEITCLKEYDSIVKLLAKLNYFFVINSSAVQFSKTTAECLKQGNACIIISVDAGTKDVHEKIKGVKSFDKVWKNIKKYTMASRHEHSVNVKYIIVPGYNDTEFEINTWLNNCQNAGVKNVVLGIDLNYFEPNRDNISPHIFELFEKTRIKAEKMGFNFYIANRATLMLTIGKYANPFWEKYRYDDGRYSNFYFERNSI